MVPFQCEKKKKEWLNLNRRDHDLAASTDVVVSVAVLERLGMIFLGAAQALGYEAHALAVALWFRVSAKRFVAQSGWSGGESPGHPYPSYYA